jgi:hypothetical protein
MVPARAATVVADAVSAGGGEGGVRSKGDRYKYNSPVTASVTPTRWKVRLRSSRRMAVRTKGGALAVPKCIGPEMPSYSRPRRAEMRSGPESGARAAAWSAAACTRPTAS